MQPTDDKADRLFLADTLTPGQELFDAQALVDGLATYTTPLDYRPQLRGKIALTKDVVGQVSELLQPDVSIKLDTLGDVGCTSVVSMDVGEPDCRWDILCVNDEYIFQNILQRSIHQR